MLFQAIMRSLPRNHENLLREVMSQVVTGDGTKRAIVHVGDVKMNSNAQLSSINSAPKRGAQKEIIDDDQDEEEEGQSMLEMKMQKKKRKDAERVEM